MSVSPDGWDAVAAVGGGCASAGGGAVTSRTGCSGGVEGAIEPVCGCDVAVEVCARSCRKRRNSLFAFSLMTSYCFAKSSWIAVRAFALSFLINCTNDAHVSCWLTSRRSKRCVISPSSFISCANLVRGGDDRGAGGAAEETGGGG